MSGRNIMLSEKKFGKSLSAFLFASCTDLKISIYSFSILLLAAFFVSPVHAAPSVIAEVSAVLTPTADTTPSVTFSSSEVGTLSVGGSCGSVDVGPVGTGNISITLTQPDNATALTAGSYSDCTLTVDDGLANTSNVLALTAFVIDTTAPVLAEVTAVATPTSDTTPAVTFSNTKAGTLSVGGSCGSASEGAVGTGSITIDLTQTDNATPLTAGTYSDCTLTVDDGLGNTSNVLALTAFVIDTTASVLAEVTAVATPTSDTTPAVTFSNSKAGTLSVGGSCGSASEGAVGTGNIPITLTQPDNATPLTAGGYSDCTLTVDDGLGNTSNVLALTAFVIDTTASVLAEVTAVATPTSDTTPAVTFSNTKAGTLSVGGSCGSASEGAVGTGNIPITLTQPDNATPLTAGTYSDCTLTVDDGLGNTSNVVTLTPFVIDTSAPTVNTNAGITLDEGSNSNIVSAVQLSSTDNLSGAANVVYTLVSTTSNGTLRKSGGALTGGATFTQSDINNNFITYDHNGSETTSDTFIFTVRDQVGNVNNNAATNFTFTFEVTPVNDAPTGSVTITGTATEGQTLTASNDLADGDNIEGEVTYQWKRGVNNIVGATTATYVLVQDDVDSIITVTASYTDGEGTLESVISGSTDAVVNVNDAPTGSVLISGIATEGETLTVSNTLADEDGIGSISYQWKRNGSKILGETSEEYILVQEDVNMLITVTASYTDAGNTEESVTSAPTTSIANINEVGTVIINGVLAVGQTLEANITDADGTDNLVLDPVNYPVTYQWKRDGNDIAGATFREYTLVAADLASAITVAVTYVDDQDTTESLTSSSMVTVKDETPPVIIVPNDITVTAEGVFTKIDIGVATAIDNIDGELIPTSDAPDQFKPGITTVMWRVEDAAGNPMVGLQIITVKPLVDFSVDKVAAENTGVNGTSFSIFLNGKVSYDIKVPYTISGTADGIDHDLMNGFAIIVSERDVAEVPFTIHEDLDLEGMENIVITMGEPTPDAAIGIKSTLTINISEQNIAPVVSLSANQAAIQTRTIAVGSGAVTVSSDASDPNTNDKLTYDWSATDNALFDIDAADGVFTFNPFGLEPGSYVLRLSVSDGFSTSKTELSLNIFTDAPAPELIVDSDNDGIPDVLDSGDKTNILPSRTGLFTSGLLETEAGLVFGLGDIAFMTGKGQAKVSMADISNDGKPDDVGFAYPSDLFDFDIEGLGKAGQSVNVVLPQQTAIPADAAYRKLVGTNWQAFVVDDNNAIASAPGIPGFCPPSGDAQYQLGLTQGYFCVQLTIEDGGANDGDGAANNRISDPSGVATVFIAPKPPGTDDSNGIFGLGSLSIWWLSLFGLFGLRNFYARAE